MQHFKAITNDQFSPRGGSGHGWDFSKDRKKIVKLNKHGKAVYSLIEFFNSKVIHKLLPKHTPDIDLVCDKSEEEKGKYQIKGVAVDCKEGLIDYCEVNVIRLIADIQRGDIREHNYGHGSPELVQRLKVYFSDDAQGEARRLQYLSDYYLIVFIRNFLQEDDLHKGNHGFYFDGKGDVKAFAIDFDLLFQSAIGANFDMTRKSQIGSPFGKFKVTLNDIVNFPEIKDSKPGHNPSIAANSIEAESITNNAGRYTREDVEAFRYLSTLPQYDSKRKESIVEGLQRLLNFDVNQFYKDWSHYRSSQLAQQENILFRREAMCDFPHLFAVEFAKIQIAIFRELSVAGPLHGDEDFRAALWKIKSDHLAKYHDYISVDKINSIKTELLTTFTDYSGEVDIVVAFKQAVERLEADYYLHFYEKEMKLLTIELMDVVAAECNLKQLTELVQWWKSLEQGFILKSRQSGYWARKFKKYGYNHNVTTYVTLRDILTHRALVLRAQGEKVHASLLILTQRDSLLDSHSERPLWFTDRILLRFLATFCKSFNLMGYWKNYIQNKSGWEGFLFKSVVFIPLVIVKDIIKFVTEILPFFFGMRGAYSTSMGS